jgi:single stranded DNA-binding protein
MVNVIFNGRLGADAEVRTAKSGKQYVAMRVATDEFKNGEKGTAWINVTYHGDRAIKMQEYLKKGSAVSVMGSETVSTYQSKNGETMVSRDVLADRIEFLNLGKSGESQSNDSAATDTGTFKPTANGEEVAAASAAATTSDDDLPF